MANHPVHWAEGVLLSPHHFQAAERALREEVQQSEQWNVGYAYGLRAIDIDREALQNWRVLLRRCHIRLHDGLHLRFPEAAVLSPCEIPKSAFANPQDRVMVRVAVPRLQLGRQNATAQESDSVCRYRVDALELEDENQIGRPETVDIRWINAKLIVGDEDVSGYETLPVMRLRLGTTAEAAPEIDPEYIPPILACDAWSILQDEVLANIYDQLGSVADKLARQMIDRGVAFESGHREDLERILRLQSLNTALGYMANLPFVRGVHPLTAYMELCRVVGLLAVFQPQRRMPEVPRYDHDDLATCFYTLRRLLEISPTERKMYVKRPFIGAGKQMRVRLEREWLDSRWEFFVGVESNLSFNEIEALLSEGGIDMKVGASEQVDIMFERGRSGVYITAEPQPPRDLPRSGWTYWKVDRTSPKWTDVEDSLNLGIRFNTDKVEGKKVDGEQRVRFREADGNIISLSFALYALQKHAG